MGPHEHSADTQAPQTALDPVCGMTVSPAKAKGAVKHKGQTYYFCSAGCAQRFQAEPEKYLLPRPPLTTLITIASAQPAIAPSQSQMAARKQVKYVCPMDPEVLEDKPGPCPMCGMALEPSLSEGAAEEDDSELHSMQSRFWASAVLSIPL